MKIAVIGATSKTGRYLISRLCDDGHAVRALGRDRGRLDALDPRAEKTRADLERPETIARALADADRVVSLAHARFAETVLAGLPAGCRQVVLTGSTRRFSALADPAADDVRRGEAALAGSGRPGIMLHPSMIYGAPDDRNVNRILRYIRRWPRPLAALVPLPDGGRHTVQPVFVDDVVAAFAAAVTGEPAPAAADPIVVAGPEPITYAEMVRACARALGRRALIVGVPSRLLAGAAAGARGIGLPVPFAPAEIRRAIEDKRFDVGDLRDRLGVTPVSFEHGLRMKIERGWY